jgi:hypothetical protein
MLSLRDTGKIRQNNESILHLAGNCGFPAHVPFSLTDFIRKDCSEDVKHLRLCVVLFMWSPPKTKPPVFTKKDKSWFENYFLNIGSPNGIARFWYKESFGKLKIEGKVLDWTLRQDAPKTIFDTDGSGKLISQINRNTALTIAKQIATSQNEDIDAYDGFIAVVGVNNNVVVAGDASGNGATFAIGTNHNHTCHEVGHIIGNRNGLYVHSFGLEKQGTRGGVYGHPYCIMSAETFGGAYTAMFTPPTASNPEEKNQGPGLCGGTRARLGWANAIDYNLNDEKEAEFELQSLGSNRPNAQVILIRKGDKTFYVEYRSSKDENDQVITNLTVDGVVVIGILTGGIAAGEKDGRHKINGTFIGQIPVGFASPFKADAVINFEPNWGIKVTHVSSNSGVTVRIVRNFTFSLRTYRRTHDIDFFDGSSSFQIDGSPDYEARCDLYDNVGRWRLDGQPIKSLRTLLI